MYQGVILMVVLFFPPCGALLRAGEEYGETEMSFAQRKECAVYFTEEARVTRISIWVT